MPTIVDGIGPKYGPAAVALVLAVSAGMHLGTDETAADLLGISVRKLRDVRTELVRGDVLSYTSGTKSTPAVYRLTVPGHGALCQCKTDAAPKQTKRNVETCRSSGADVQNLPVISGRKAQPTDELFEVICGFAGDGVRISAGGRVAKLAHQMLKAGLTSTRLGSELPIVVARFASWRKVLDLDTITVCWPWILAPPATIEKPNSIDMLREAVVNNGGQAPW